MWSHLLDFQLAFEAECCRDTDELEKRKAAWLRWVQGISLATISSPDRRRCTDLPYHLYYGVKNFLFQQDFLVVGLAFQAEKLVKRCGVELLPSMHKALDVSLSIV